MNNKEPDANFCLKILLFFISSRPNYHNQFSIGQINHFWFWEDFKLNNQLIRTLKIEEIRCHLKSESPKSQNFHLGNLKLSRHATTSQNYDDDDDSLAVKIVSEFIENRHRENKLWFSLFTTSMCAHLHSWFDPYADNYIFCKHGIANDIRLQHYYMGLFFFLCCNACINGT